MWAGYRSFGDPTGRASGFSGAISLIFTKRGTWATELVKLTRCVPIPSQYAVAVQDRRRITHFRSQIEQGKLPLDKDSKKNLETGKPLDLLPDRTAEAVLPWLASHQEIEVVSRDRASAYADAVKRALPHATQVADRYHLVVRRIGACLDTFQRKEGLRAKTPKTVAYLAGKPKEDSSMRQRQTCPKAFTARSACLARHGEATLPNLAYQRR